MDCSKDENNNLKDCATESVCPQNKMEIVHEDIEGEIAKSSIIVFPFDNQVAQKSEEVMDYQSDNNDIGNAHGNLCLEKQEALEEALPKGTSKTGEEMLPDTKGNCLVASGIIDLNPTTIKDLNDLGTGLSNCDYGPIPALPLSTSIDLENDLPDESVVKSSPPTNTSCDMKTSLSPVDAIIKPLTKNNQCDSSGDVIMTTLPTKKACDTVKLASNGAITATSIMNISIDIGKDANGNFCAMPMKIATSPLPDQQTQQQCLSDVSDSPPQETNESEEDEYVQVDGKVEETVTVIDKIESPTESTETESMDTHDEVTGYTCGCGMGLNGSLSHYFNNMRKCPNDGIKLKIKLCSNPTYKCTLPCVEQSNFCERHILYDGDSQFVACRYKYENGRLCTGARRRDAESKYCVEHTLECLEEQSKQNTLLAVNSNEYHLQHLMQHVQIDEDKLLKEAMLEKQDEFIDVEDTYCTPFVCHENVDCLENIARSAKKRCQLDENDNQQQTEEPCIHNTFRYCDDISDDDVSVDSEFDDPLKHASVYTNEELVKQALQRTEKLRDLYLRQLMNLQNLHKERRQVYLQEIKKEREILCSIKDQPQDTPEEQRHYDELKALNTYHRHHGKNAILYKKYKIKCAEANGYIPKGPGFALCFFVDNDGIKCMVRALPCTKYCSMHITLDRKQLLYRECGVKNGDIRCNKPIISCTLFSEQDGCILHSKLPKKLEVTLNGGCMAP